MGRAKEIQIRVIPAKIANPFIRAHHYSGKVVSNSQLHFGAFLDGRLHGVLSYGPSLDKKKVIGLVEGTTWDGFLELNRMAFDDYLPRNSESYCIAKTIRMIRKQAPQIKWIISFADGYTKAETDTRIRSAVNAHNTAADAHTDIRTATVKLKSEIDTLSLKFTTNVTKNPFSATFSSLDGLTVAGVWNADLARIEF